MKVKILVSYYVGEPGFELLRVYQEEDFKQAEKDLELLESLCSGKTIQLQDCEVYKSEKDHFCEIHPNEIKPTDLI